MSDIRRLAASFVYLIAAASILLGAQAAAITFDDGLVHIIDAGNSFPFETVYVRDGPGGAPTWLRVVAGGEIGTGGFSDGLQAYENSIIFVEGGTIGAQIVARDQTNMTITGGTVNGGIFFIDNATGVVDAVDGKSVHVRQNATATINGGNFSVYSSDFSGNTEIFGGSFEEIIIPVAASFVRINGGTFVGSVEAHGGALEIFGGDFNQSPLLVSLNTALVVIRGSNFNLPLGDLQSTSGTLIGALADSTPVNIAFGRSRRIGDISWIFARSDNL